MGQKFTSDGSQYNSIGINSTFREDIEAEKNGEDEDAIKALEIIKSN